MSALKKFFEKKKMDIKFKKAGGGHKLTENTRQVGLVSTQAASQPRAGPSSESKMAAEAAMARLSQPRAGKTCVLLHRHHCI